MTAHANIVEEAVALAEKWQNQAEKILTAKEKSVQRQMMRLIQNPNDKVILTKMIDQILRSQNNRRIADQVNFMLRK